MKKSLLVAVASLMALFILSCTEDASLTNTPNVEEVSIDIPVDPVLDSAIRGDQLRGTQEEPRLLVLIWDGKAADKKIRDNFWDAYNDVNATQYIREVDAYYLEGDESNPGYITNWLTTTYESKADPNEWSLLLIGKSRGGAKTYKMVADYLKHRKIFQHINVVLCDAHEGPGNPGDAGQAYPDDTDDWNEYDHVRFQKHASSKYGNYQLYPFNAPRVTSYNTYQRGDNLKGYSFPSAVENPEQTFGDDNSLDDDGHSKISATNRTEDLLESAIRNLLSKKVDSDYYIIPYTKTILFDDFEDGWSGWGHYNYQDNRRHWGDYRVPGYVEAYVMQEPYEEDENKALVTYLSWVGTEPWHVHAFNTNFSLLNQRKYVVTFKAKTETYGTGWDSNRNRKIQVLMSSDDTNDYMTYGMGEFTINSTMQEYSFEFTMTEPTDTHAGIYFDMGYFSENGYAYDVYIDDVKIVESFSY